jgi:hypothetical protein
LTDTDAAPHPFAFKETREMLPIRNFIRAAVVTVTVVGFFATPGFMHPQGTAYAERG